MASWLAQPALPQVRPDLPAHALLPHVEAMPLPLQQVLRGRRTAAAPQGPGALPAALLRQLFCSCLTSGLIVGTAVLIVTLHTTQDRPYHKWLTMEDTVYCRGPVL